MPRLSPADRLYKDFREAYGSRAVTTERGDPRANYRPQEWGGLRPSVRPRLAIEFERPARDIDLARYMIEMYNVASPFSQAIRQTAIDASQDEMADELPQTIVVNESLPAWRKKVYDYLWHGLKRLDIGTTTAMRNRRRMFTGDTFGQIIFEYDKVRWHATRYELLPTWEMLRDPRDNTYRQVRRKASSLEAATLARWEIPNFILRSANDEDHGNVYGIPIGQYVTADYRGMIMAIEDLIVGARSRAAQKFKYKYGSKDSHVPVPLEELFNWRDRMELETLDVLTSFWLRNNYEDVEAIMGDPSGVRELREIVEFWTNRMKRSLGMPVDPEKQKGRGLESIDATHARLINNVRTQDGKFIKQAGDQILLLEGIEQVDWTTMIPPLGETPLNRVNRANSMRERAYIGNDIWSSIVGLNPETARADAEADIKWHADMGLDLDGASRRNDRGDTVGTESPDAGADPQAGRDRRKTQRDGGKTPSGA